MTHERDSESAQSSPLLEPRPILQRTQYAHDETSTMSNFGLCDIPDSYEYKVSGGWIVHSEQDSVGSVTPLSLPGRVLSRPDQLDEFPDPRPRKRQRISFYDFAAQARLQNYHEQRQRQLIARRRTLQKTIALSARLKRTNTLIRDGLVEISKHQDPAAFARVYQHAQDLVDFCHSQWNHELRNLKSDNDAESFDISQRRSDSFLSRLPNNIRKDFLELITTLRKDPAFLVERFRSLSASQVAALSGHPKWEDFSESVLSTFSNDSGRHSQKRKLLQFSKSLQDYATSFERSSPLSFLLFNLYGPEQSFQSSESQLRLSTWSTICAELLSSHDETAQTLLGQILNAFALVCDWHARDRVELFLMDHLQKGAFLLEEDPKHRPSFGYDPLATPQAQQFFDKAVYHLLSILGQNNGGYPIGALQLAKAILSKLPSVEERSSFRGHFFSTWFLEYFLRITITYPENENMLLKVHIGKQARERLLAHLVDQIIRKVEDLQSGMYVSIAARYRTGLTFHRIESADDEENQYNVSSMINVLVEDEVVSDPYQDQKKESAELTQTSVSELPSIIICAAEVVQLLEALSPQFKVRDSRTLHTPWGFDPFLRETRTAFQAQYSRASNRFDRLKTELLHRVLEPGSSINDSHPCQEEWLHLLIDTYGNPSETLDDELATATSTLSTLGSGLNIAQKAAIRLCSEESGLQDLNDSTSFGFHPRDHTSLIDLFRYKIVSSENQIQNIELIYWKKALKYLEQNYPLTKLVGDDSAILTVPLEDFQRSQRWSLNQCTEIEKHLSVLEKTFSSTKIALDDFGACLEQLRLKLWYSKQVTHWPGYTDARNVASALNHMSLSSTRNTTNLHNFSTTTERPSSSRSGMSSIFGQPKKDAMSLLKAPTEFGGPKKLADPQIESTRRWLKRKNIDNFCKGEERLHRFCMEVTLLAEKLTKETLVENPELWSSDLFSRESSLFDVQALGISSAPASTRPASVMSDSPSSTYMSSRPSIRMSDSDARSVMSDDQRFSFRRPSVYSSASNRINRDLFAPELASSIGSHGRASSAITGSGSSIFSTPSRSVTSASASAYSGPSSVLNDNGLARFTCNPKEKRKFLDKVQQGLVCLLLSDLGSLVWSWGSETDTWLVKAQKTDSVASTLDKRLTYDELLTESTWTHSKKAHIQRRASMTDVPLSKIAFPVVHDTSDQCQSQVVDELDVNYVTALADTLHKISQHVDPVEKLNAMNEFCRLTQLQFDSERQAISHQDVVAVSNASSGRRKSLDSLMNNLSLKDNHNMKGQVLPVDLAAGTPRESDFVTHMKRQLVILKPKTIFRDLQYVAVFASADLLDKTSNGKAFLHLGLAALEYKVDLCRSMVNVADQIVEANSTKRQSVDAKLEQPVSEAAEYWKIAALEGNATAQRELAVLYLTHPEVLPIISLPLFLSGDIFRDEMVWQESVEGSNNRQALCLALHWMQQAALNGDVLAQRRLHEREGVTTFQ